MKISMDFNRDKAEKIVAMAMDVRTSVTKAMSDEELITKAFEYASTYGFCNLKIEDE